MLNRTLQESCVLLCENKHWRYLRCLTRLQTVCGGTQWILPRNTLTCTCTTLFLLWGMYSPSLQCNIYTRTCTCGLCIWKTLSCTLHVHVYKDSRPLALMCTSMHNHVVTWKRWNSTGSYCTTSSTLLPADLKALAASSWLASLILWPFTYTHHIVRCNFNTTQHNFSGTKPTILCVRATETT